MREFLVRTSHKPRPLPPGRWAVTQRWNDLLFAHWPVPTETLAKLLPEWLRPDTYQGSAWLGIVPFWLDRIRVRGAPTLPGTRNFPDLNLRTYVRDQFTGAAGVYCFSFDASNILAIAAARMLYHLPYYWADMRFEQRSEREFAFSSSRHFAGGKVNFNARYRGLGPTHKTAEQSAGSFECFFSERAFLFSSNRAGEPIRAHLHHVPWPLEMAEAEIDRNDLATAIGIELPQIEPVLHYSRRLAVYVWPTELLRPAMAGRPVTVAAAPTS